MSNSNTSKTIIKNVVIVIMCLMLIPILVIPEVDLPPNLPFGPPISHSIPKSVIHTVAGEGSNYTQQQVISDLQIGWNLVSIQVLPEDKRPENVLSLSYFTQGGNPIIEAAQILKAKVTKGILRPIPLRSSKSLNPVL